MQEQSIATQTARTRESLEFTLSRLATAMQSMHTGWAHWDLKTGGVQWSEEGKDLLGFASDEEASTMQGWLRRVHPEDRARVKERFDRFYVDFRDFYAEYRVVCADGKVRWLFGSGRAIYDESGVPYQGAGLVIDITNRKRVEQSLRDSEERFRLLIEGAKDYAMYLMDDQGIVTFWSVGAERVFGFKETEMLGRNIEVTFLPEDLAAGLPEKNFARACREEKILDRGWRLRSDGSHFWVDGMLMCLLEDAGQVRGYAMVARDGTENRREEEAVLHANELLEKRVAERTQSLAERTEELAEMSQMRQELLRRVVTVQEEEAARISRDLHDDTGQQITGLLFGLDNLKKHPAVAENQEAQAILAHIKELAGDVARKSHRISFTLRPTALDDMGLVAALQNYCETWSTWSGLRIEVESMGFDGGRLPKEIETTIYRVVQEALTNILKHATQSGSWVSVFVQLNVVDVLTVIEDDGPGFDAEEVMSRPPGERRLGIFGMQERARLVGGGLEVESSPGEGTTVYLRIPLPPV